MDPSQPAAAAAHPQAPAHAAADALPPGASHWDRLPREIRSDIIHKSGPLTRWTTGVLETNDLWNLPMDEDQQLWIDIFETEWPGDLATVPDFAILKFTLWHVRSRALYDRYKAAFNLERTSNALREIAARCRFDDELDWDDPQELLSLAVRSAAMSLMRELVDVRRVAVFTESHACAACDWDFVEVLEFIGQHMPDGQWSTQVMNVAAAAGSIRCLDWLDANRTEGCDDGASQMAVRNGKFVSVRWLHAHGKLVMNHDVVSVAAMRGRVEILEWCMANGFSQLIMDPAIDKAVCRSKDTFDWLSRIRPVAGQPSRTPMVGG
ncbi:hypothetical protein HK105_206697 [Polyrhizophydium stewartii]|uniref:Ankyrin repeat protein n=1 Tax=Polyrhizophydium stewartii TaxID=2732419 RepID=A0ABR4N2X5_9FUNG